MGAAVVAKVTAALRRLVGEGVRPPAAMTQAPSLSGKQLHERAVRITSAVEAIPGGAQPGTLEQELDFIRVVHPGLRGRLQGIREKCSMVANKIAALARPAWSPVVEVQSLYAPAVADAVDAMLESAAGSLDVVEGVSGAPSKPAEGGARDVVPIASAKRKHFQIEYDTSKTIRPKTSQIFINERHPFEELIKKGLSYNPKSPLYAAQAGTVALPAALEETPLHWVDTDEALGRLGEDLARHSIFAVDLEHHSFQSYYGLTCLMQISTAEADYLVDTILLRESIGPILGGAFSDASKLKVFHGAQSDIQWLQRDFNVFIVNMFDTFFASKELGYASHSLAFLLSHYVGITLDKQYQLADWRVRPIEGDLARYARMDTHYLLYVYERIKQDLAVKAKGQPQLILSVLRSSAQSALTLFKPDTFDPNGWRTIVGRSSVRHSEREIARIKAIFAWRDVTGRKEDLSASAVIPNGLVIQLAQGTADQVLHTLTTYKYPVEAAIRNVESLKAVLLGGGAPVSQPKASGEATAAAVAKRSHIIFSDDGEEQPAAPPLGGVKATEKEPPLPPQGGPPGKGRVQEGASVAKVPRPVVVSVATTSSKGAAPTKARFAPTISTGESQSGSMAGLFVGSQPSRRHADGRTGDADVASTMNIAKVSRAASALLLHSIGEGSSGAAAAPSKEDALPIGRGKGSDAPAAVPERVVYVMSSGDAFEGEQVLKLATAEPHRSISLAKEQGAPLAHSRPAEASGGAYNKMDLSKAAAQMLEGRNGGGGSAGSHYERGRKKSDRSEVAPSISAPKAVLGPRLHSSSNRGNRSGTF